LGTNIPQTTGHQMTIQFPPDQSRLYQSLLKFKNISERHPVDTLLHDSQTL